MCDTPYNAFQHLCSVAFPYNATERVMAFYSAYWDESGTHEPRLLTLAGYVATDEQWAEFAREWDEALKREGVEIFHMSEFENPYGNYTEEKGWPEDRRINFQSKLIGIIKRRISIGIFHSMDVAAYDELITGWRRERNGTAYNFSVKSCMAHVAMWGEHFQKFDPVAHAIEHGAGYNHEIEKAFHATFNNEDLRRFFRLGSLNFETKKRAVQLQAADLLAYESWKDEYNNYILQPNERRRRRPSFQKLIQAPHIRCFFGRADLEKMVELEQGDYERVFPSGFSIKYRPPEINKVTITADSSELDELLDELSRLMELSPHLIYPLIDSSANVSKLISINTDNVTASDAGDFRVLFKPTDFLLSRMPALRAGEGQSGISE